MGIELKATSGNITLTAPKYDGSTVDLSNYYTKSETDTKIQDVINSIPEVDLSAYATVDYVDNAVSNINMPDLTPYALKSEIPDVSNFITAEEATIYIDSTELNNALAIYAKTTDIPDVSAYQTETQVNTLISNALNAIGVAEEGAY